MKIGARQLEGHLRKGIAPLYAVHGAETLLALEAADRIREAARKDGCSEREIFFAEPGVDWSRFGAAAANLSLFASRRLVELRIPTGKPGAEGGRAIEAWCARLTRGREAPAALRGREAPAEVEDTVTLVMLPELEWQQMKSKWFEALDGAGIVVEAKAVTRDELPDWLARRLGLQQQRASVETLEWLADRVEGNLLAAKQEVEKLALLLPPGEITLASIRDAVTDVARFERDALIDAIHESDAPRIVRAAASLEAGGEPLPLLLWTLCEELRKLMAIANGQRPRGFLQPERMAALQKTAKRHDDASFNRLLALAHRIDLRSKGVESGDPWNSVVEMALGLAGKHVLADVAA